MNQNGDCKRWMYVWLPGFQPTLVEIGPDATVGEALLQAARRHLGLADDEGIVSTIRKPMNVTREMIVMVRRLLGLGRGVFMALVGTNDPTEPEVLERVSWRQPLGTEVIGLGFQPV